MHDNKNAANPTREGFAAHVRTNSFAHLMVAPILVLILALVAYPFFFAIGLANLRYLFQTAIFTSAIKNTVVIVLATDLLKLGMGLAWRCLSIKTSRAVAYCEHF